MNVRYKYNRQISPPAPFVQVTIARADNLSVSAPDLPAQIDTAADMSVIPQAIVDRLQLAQLDQVAIEGFGGHVSLVPTYVVGLIVHSLAPQNVRVIADRDEPFVLLGRDVLNRFKIQLDGPNLIMEISSD